MPWEKGKSGNSRTMWKKGQSGNPTGRSKAEVAAYRDLVAIAQRVMTSAEGKKIWLENVEKKWRENPWAVWRWLISVSPREQVKLTKTERGTLAQYTVDQLQKIATAGELPAAEKDIQAEVEINE